MLCISRQILQRCNRRIDSRIADFTDELPWKYLNALNQALNTSF